MASRVAIHRDFASDVDAQLAWLARHQDASWIDGLELGIAEAIALVESAPAVGVASGRVGGSVLCKLILRRLPFVVWYVHDDDPATGKIWFLRLFHVRQDRPSALGPRRRRG